MKEGKTMTWFVGLCALLLGLAAGFWYGDTAGYSSAQADVKAQQETLAKQKSEQAAQAANPFTTVNPVAPVQANPFQDAQKALNPF